MADNIFNDDNRVIHEDADREDESKERDPVERVSVEVENEEREAQRHGNSQKNDQGFAPTEEEEDQDRDAEDRQPHVEQQFVGFVAGGRSVVAGDRDADVGRNQGAAEAIHFGDHGFHHVHGIRAGTFGNA